MAACVPPTQYYLLYTNKYLIQRHKQIEIIEIMNSDQVSENTVANFVQKAFEIISHQDNKRYVEWLPNGKQFIIKNIEEFEEIILPKYFRHRNINSFIRQLNMYGFHKSRQEPTKNIFSHSFFQRGKKQLLGNVKRKIKMIESGNQTPKKPACLEQPKISEPVITAVKQQDNKIVEVKKPSPKKEIQLPLISSSNSLGLRSLSNVEKEQISPLKNLLISRSLIMDINPQACLKHRENQSFIAHQEEEDDDLSIEDQINQERQRFNNRTQGIAIVRTSNFLSDFQL